MKELPDFMLTRNYAKEFDGVFARITAKISAFTFSQYAKHINDRPFGKVKYTLD